MVTRNQKFGRVLPVPAKPLRPLLKAAHRSGLLAMDEGWLDMGVQVPLMDNSRAKQELGWAPRISGAEALDELIRGMAAGDGTASAPMRARGGTPVAESWLPSKDHRVPDDVDAMALRQYMADHVAEQIRAEQNFLQALMVRQNFARPGIAGPALWAGERVARLKSYFPEGLKITPSVLVLETELMLSAVTGKLHGWRTMLNESEALGVSEEVFQQLVDDAQEQYGLLERVHKYARERAFAEDRETDVEDSLAKA